MRDDELQVLGEERKRDKRRYLLVIAVLGVALLALVGTEIYQAMTPRQPEKIKTGKKMGDPTIVPELQAISDTLLKEKLMEINGIHGQVIVMEVQTGEILAMVGVERNFKGDFQPCKNLAYQQDLGQMTMTASLLALLETGKTKLSDSIDVGNGIWPVEDDIQMKDHNWKRGGYGRISLEEALELSSNIGIARVVSSTFGDNQQEFFDLLDKMSFGQPDSIDGISGLQATSFSSPKDADWESWKIWWSAIGYERKIAPIQMLTFYNAIANGGKMVKPTLKTGEMEIINPQIASKANIDSMQVALEHVVSQGLGRKAGTPFVSVAGKSGTTQVGEYEFGGETYVDEYQLAFCGYFPANAPRYSIIVSMNKFGLPVSGGGMGGDLFRNIVEGMVALKMIDISLDN